MTDYRNLMERCKEVLAWKKTGKLEGDALRNYAEYSLPDFLSGDLQQAEKSTMDDAMMAVVELVALVEKLQARVAYLESRLEVTPEHDIDGIAARDATIKLQDGRIAELEANRAELAKQALVAWDSGEEWEPLAFCLCAEENGLDSCHELIWEGYPPEPWGERWQKYEREAKRMIDLVGQYAAPPVITQHEPVTTVEDRYNADGKSCHITDDLPAGMPLYAAPPVAAPVRLTDEQAEKVDEAIREALGDAYDCLRVWNAWSYGTMGPDDFSQVAEDSDRVAEIRNAAAVALGFKLEGEQ